jgi:hypothetical protein
LFEHPTVAAAAAVALPVEAADEEAAQTTEPETGALVGIELSDEDLDNLLEELK